MTTEPTIARDRIDVALARELVREQFPEWARLDLREVERPGNDHRMFRLGEQMSVRLPADPGYVPQVEKEQTWLPRLAPQLPRPIPVVLGAGRASTRFPAPWSVYDWKPGVPASVAPIDDRVAFAVELAGFLAALRAADATGGPAPGPHSAYRGAPLEHYDAEMRDILHRVHGRERDVAAGIWRDALDAPFDGEPVWFHGDVAATNLLVTGGRLSAVIDFGCSGAGDPSCDTTIAWTFFDGDARRAFVEAVALDDATWARGRGWAIWKALIMITNTPPGQAELARRVLDELSAGRR